MASKVYFSKTITPEKVLEMYDLLGVELKGHVAVKLHSGEKGNQNFLGPDFWKPIIDKLGDATVVETNTLYNGSRGTTDKHWQTMKDHDWSDHFPVDIMDGESPDMQLLVPGGKVLTKNFVGRTLPNYDSLLVLSHFKGHPMGGFGGALKQLSIGMASAKGKGNIHGGGIIEKGFGGEHMAFLDAMADAASTIHKRFEGKVAYISVMKNLSVDCDCCAEAEDPCMKDIGILASLDPIAIDQAGLDLIYAQKDDPGLPHMLERIESRNGAHTIEAAAALGFGSREYELIQVD